MASQTELAIGDTRLHLLGDRGVFWPRHGTLFVADPHFGKDASFRRAGIPVPPGSTEGTLRRISSMLVATSANHLVILGDMFHTRSSLSEDVCRAMQEFFDQHASLLITLVRGNHDAHVGKLPTEWPVDTIQPGKTIDGVMLAHDPAADLGEANLVLCGHVHPSINYHSPTDAVRRVRCFYLSDQRLVLPAVGEFTGTHVVNPRQVDRVWVVADQQVVEISTRRSRA